MASRDQELRELPASVPVVRSDGGEAPVVLRAVEEQDRYARGVATGHEVRGHRDRGQHDPVDLVVEDLAEHVVDVVHALRRHEDEDAVPPFLQGLRQLLERDRVESVVEIGDHQADDAAAPGNEGSGERVGTVAEFGRRLQDPGPHAFGDRGARGEGPAHGRLAHPRLAGDVQEVAIDVGTPPLRRARAASVPLDPSRGFGVEEMTDAGRHGDGDVVTDPGPVVLGRLDGDEGPRRPGR